MAFLKKYWYQIRAFLEQLPRDTKWLIIALAVILVFTGVLVIPYAAMQDMVALNQVDPSRREAMYQRLKAAQIDAKMNGSVLFVPHDQEKHSLAIVAQSDALAGDTAGAFEQMIERQSPWTPDRQSQQNMMIARQTVYGQIISLMDGIKSAHVLIDMPENRGFGGNHVRPTASVTVVMEGRPRVTRRMVDAIAALVSGGIAGMQIGDVEVIDANNNRSFRAGGPDNVDVEEVIQHVDAQENRYRAKVLDALKYIPNVNVAVNVLIDSVLKQETESIEYETTEPVREDFSREETREDVDRTGEPGARPNTGMDIAGGAGTTRKENVTETRVQFGDKNLTGRTITQIGGRKVKQINVTVGVPRPYFVALYLQSKAGEEGETAPPDDAALRPIIDEQMKLIQEKVETLALADSEPTVRVSMIPDPQRLFAALNPEVATGSMLQTLGGVSTTTMSLAGLMLLAVGMMVFMVRKAMRQPQMPTVEELAGVPPELPVDEQLLDEAIEDEGSLAGVEIDEEEIRTRQIADQIGDMVKANPAEVSTLLGKWIRTED